VAAGFWVSDARWTRLGLWRSVELRGIGGHGMRTVLVLGRSVLVSFARVSCPRMPLSVFSNDGRCDAKLLRSERAWR
jgi:hypothetical protein